MSKRAFALRFYRRITLLAIAAQAVDSKEVLQLLGKVTVAIDVLVGRHGQAREGSLLAGNRIRRGAVEMLRH